MHLFELHAGGRIFTASRQPGPLSGEAPNSLRERTTFVGAVTSCHSNNTGNSRAVHHRYGSSTSTAGHEGEEYLPDQRSEGTLQASTHHNHKLFSRVAPPQQQQQRQQNNLEQRERETVAQNHNSQRFTDIALMNKKTGERESFQSSNLRLEFPVHYVAT